MGAHFADGFAKSGGARMSGPMGVALIGAGMIAESHLRALSDLQERLRLVTVLSRRPEKAEPLARFYDGPVPVFTSDMGVILSDPDIQFVIVATPPEVRLDLIAALAKAGKHILLEKPVARTLTDARQVVELCDAAGVSLGVLFQHRMQTGPQAAAHLIGQGQLGALGLAEISVPLWRDQSYYDEPGRGTYARDGGGVMLTQAIHTIDLALSLTGPVERVQAMATTTPLHQMEAEDFVVAGLHFASGVPGSLMASTASFPGRREVITLHYDHATLRLMRDQVEVLWRDGRREVWPERHDAPPKYVWHKAVIEDFARALSDNRPPLVSGRAALAAHALIDAVERSARTSDVAKVC